MNPLHVVSLPTTSDKHMIDVAVVSTNPVIREGLAMLLAAQASPPVRVRFQVESVTALPSAPHCPKVAIVDLYPHEPHRITAAFWALLDPAIAVIALCRPDDVPDLPCALGSGVRAFLTRESSTESLQTAVTAVQSSELYVCAELVPHLVDQARPRSKQHRQTLSNREIETLQWLVQGLTHGQISRRMGLTEATVSTYVKRIRTKLNVGNKAELTRRAIELGYALPGKH